MGRILALLILLCASVPVYGQALEEPLDVGACNAPLQMENPVKYVGNRYSQKFHCPTCPFAEVMWVRRRREFHFRYEAIEAGYKACCWCLPKRWKHVEGRIFVVPRIDPVSVPYSN